MRVLVVEDEPELLRVITRALCEEGYAVDGAPDGEEGLFRATSWEYDAVVLDLMLPKIDGYKVCRMLKFDEKMDYVRATVVNSILGTGANYVDPNTKDSWELWRVFQHNQIMTFFYTSQWKH